ncbi:MAG: hypothetical protein M3Q12_03720 [Pseudomonadota bacterium]|nr:hypothetical protein [Pseudomonadota bacterium]
MPIYARKKMEEVDAVVGLQPTIPQSGRLQDSGSGVWFVQQGKGSALLVGAKVPSSSGV